MNIDLDISNYDIPDLEKFLKLPPNYNENDVENKEEIIRKQIIHSNELKNKEKDDIITFLNKFGDAIDLKYNDYSFVLGLKLLY
jgi:hypothetical protein